MKIKHLPFLFILCLACQNETVKENSIITNPNIQITSTSCGMSSILTISKFTPLETTKDALIGSISKIIKKGNRFYINSSNKSLKVFSSEGEYLLQIGTLGLGPKDYSNLSDFDVDTKNIYVLTSGKILIYALNGEYVKSIPLSLNANKLKIAGDRILLFALGEEDVIYLIDKTGAIIKSALKKNQGLRLVKAIPFVDYGTNNILFSQGHSNNILVYNKQTETFSEMKFISSPKALSSSKELELMESGIKSKDIPIYGIVFDGLISSGQQTLFGSIEAENKITIWIKDFASNLEKAYLMANLKDDVTYTSPHIFLMGNSESSDTFISYIQPYTLTEGLKKNKTHSADDNYKRLSSLLQDINSSDNNPIIVEYKFK